MASLIFHGRFTTYFLMLEFSFRLSWDDLNNKFKGFEKKLSEGITGEGLNLLVGHMPLEGEEKDAVKANVLKLLKEKYDFEEEDFISAELEIVPAGPARDYGLDRSMVAGYGHDDRVCAYTSLRAVLDAG